MYLLGLWKNFATKQWLYRLCCHKRCNQTHYCFQLKSTFLLY